MARRGASASAMEQALEASTSLASRAKQQLHRLERGEALASSSSGDEAPIDDADAVGELDRAAELPEGFRDYSRLALKPDHANRPIWVCPDGVIFLEAASPWYAPAYDFLVAVAEPVARPEHVHQYRMTPNSLYAAVAVAIQPEEIVAVLDKLSKVALPRRVRAFILDCTKNYGRAKLVLRENRHYVEADGADAASALRELLSNAEIRAARDDEDATTPGGARDNNEEASFAVGDVQAEAAANRAYLELAAELDDDAPDDESSDESDEDDDSSDDDDDDEGPAFAAAAAGRGQQPSADRASASKKQRKERSSSKKRGKRQAAQAGQLSRRRTLSFRLRQGSAQDVKRVAAKELDFPLQEEYDFRHDASNATLPIDLRPTTKIRNYQEKSLQKMFGNGRARSGIIVLPCGAGKTLTAIVAAATVKRWTLVLCTNATAVAQWKAQFALWTTLDPKRVSLFTSDVKDELHAECGILITTYHMISFGGKRAADGERLIEQVKQREWGLMLLDEVHVVPAATFRKVLALCNAHCKLGLTATLVREDDLITDLNFLIGPKLYEANWMDLTHAGHLANVQCVEVWCAMAAPFYREYLRAGGAASLSGLASSSHAAGAGGSDDASSLGAVTPSTSQTARAHRSQLADGANGRKGSEANLMMRRRRLLYVMNPVKFRACEYLVRYHEDRGDKIIVFADDVYALLWYAKKLNRPAIYGATKEAERQAVLSSFRFNATVNTVCLSKVGDVAIDLPEANVIVQVSSHFGSRRQEAQRLGRILRAKPNADGSDGFNALFYTLVSKDTSEMFYSTKRQQYLVDQGYTFKVITNLKTRGADSVLNTPEAELDLLNEVLNAQWQQQEEAEEKALQKAARDDLAGNASALGVLGGSGAASGSAFGAAGGTKRATLQMSKLSGGQGITYFEYDAAKVGDLSSKTADKKRHALFKSRANKAAKRAF